MTPGHLDRLRRARDLLSVKGFDTGSTMLTCYSGAGFDADLEQMARTNHHVQLADLGMLYGSRLRADRNVSFICCCA